MSNSSPWCPFESGSNRHRGLHDMDRSINPARHLPSVSRQAQPRPYKTEPYAEDSALDNALSEEDDEFSSINLADQLSKLDSLPPSDIPPREGLYSTPLSWEKPEPGPIFWENPDPGPFSWERPQPGLRMDSLTGLNSFVLSEAERRRLIAIAMNPGPSMGGLGSNLNLNFEGQDSRLDLDLGTGFSTGTMRQESHTVPQPKPPSQRRPAPPTEPKKSDNAGEKGKEKSRAGDRTAHNDIERKYRTNLKDKIAELRDAVPSLQTISEAGPEGGDSSRPARGPKVSKVGDLSNPVRYLYVIRLTESYPGNCPYEGDGIHPPPRKKESPNRGPAPGALATSPSIPAVTDRNCKPHLPDAELQPGLIRPKSFLLILVLIPSIFCIAHTYSHTCRYTVSYVAR